MLFNRNPYLTQASNTFLPLGYCIDISADPLEPNAVTVTTPFGTTIHNTNSTPIQRIGPGIPPRSVANSTVEKQPPGELNHAIQYFNKIKARYSDDPNTYKQFLDILQFLHMLQTYQGPQDVS